MNEVKQDFWSHLYREVAPGKTTGSGKKGVFWLGFCSRTVCAERLGSRKDESAGDLLVGEPYRATRLDLLSYTPAGVPFRDNNRYLDLSEKVLLRYLFRLSPASPPDPLPCTARTQRDPVIQRKSERWLIIARI